MLSRWSNRQQQTINTYSYYTLLHTIYIILLILQGEVHSGYSKHAYSLIDQRLLQPVWRRPGYLRQLWAGTSCCSIQLSIMHYCLSQLLLIGIHRNCTRTGFDVRACTVSLPHVRKKNSFHKLICVIRIFMRNILMVQCHLRNIFNIKLFLNYGIFLTIPTTHDGTSYLMICTVLPSNNPLVVAGFMVIGWSVISWLCPYIRLPDNCNVHHIYVRSKWLCETSRQWVCKKISYSSDFPLARVRCGICTKGNLVLSRLDQL